MHIAWLPAFVLAAQQLTSPTAHADKARSLARTARTEKDMQKRGELLRASVQEAKLSRIPLAYGLAMQELSRYSLRAGNFNDALNQIQEAARILGRANAQVPLAGLLRETGLLLQQHGNYTEALNVYQEALQHQEKLGASLNASLTLQHIGLLYAQMGQRDQAVLHLNKAVSYARDSDAPVKALIRKAFLGCGYETLGEHALSIRIIEGLPKRGDLPAGVPVCLAAAYYNSGRYRDAERTAGSAFQVESTAGLDEDNGEPPVWNDVMRDKIRALWWRALARRKMGNERGALEDARLGMREVENLRGRLVSYDFMKRGFSGLFVEFATLTIEMLHASGKHEESLEIAEQGRARAFLDLLADRQEESGNPGWRFTEILPFASIPRLSSKGAQQAASARQMAATAARLGSVIISYWSSPQAVWIWTVDANQRVSCIQSPADEQMLRNLLTRASRRNGAPDRDALRSLYKLLIAPVQGLLPKPGQGAPLLTLIPHGVLFEAPFAALIDERGRYLIENYAIHFGPAAAMFDFLSARANQRDGMIVLVSSVVKPPPLPDGKQLPALPGTAIEARAIAQAAGNKAKVLSGNNASLLELKEASKSISILHFATHAVVNNEQPFDSFLALSNGERLTVRSIYGLDLKAQLVTLSACRGATGTLSADGVLGLARALFHAGAASVIASVWDVADEGTVHLMPRFYDSLRRTGSKAIALREAQLSLLRELRQGRITAQTVAGPAVLPEHPMLWGGFQLQGEPK